MGRSVRSADSNGLTGRERRVLGFMSESVAENGYPPTIREICAALNIKSTSTVHKSLTALETKGFIRKDPAKPRAIEITESGRENVTEPRTAHKPEAPEDRADVVDVPLVGQVAAGMPILAKENITDVFPIPARYISAGSRCFMLTVKGESMIEAGIFDGDYILVRQQATAENGDIVVAMVDGFESEATVKTFYRESDHIRLQPENPSMSPIIVREVSILGIVKGVFRYFN